MKDFLKMIWGFIKKTKYSIATFLIFLVYGIYVLTLGNITTEEYVFLYICTLIIAISGIVSDWRFNILVDSMEDCNNKRK